MKKTISVYWPLAIVASLALLAYLHICGNAASRVSQAPLDADQLTAELARAVSYGMVDAASALPAKPMRAATTMPLAEAS
jgi:HAMP domain-containing protein